MTANATLKVDLHSHSICSDGTLSPTALVREARARGLDVLALTDHDTVAGVAEAQAEADRAGLRLVHGVEFTVDCLGIEIHVLGLGVNCRNRALTSLCDEIRSRRRTRFMEMIARLRAVGVPLKDPEIPHEVALARPLLARVMIQQGFVATQSEAFERYLRKGRPGYVEHNRLKAVQAIEAIHAAGGLAFVAHPGLYQRGDEIVFDLRQSGLDGIECVHSDHRHDVQEHYRALADKLGLLVSGGADFHGPDHPRSVNFGKRTLPVEDFSRIEAALAARA
ncbi:MAG: PHP domain-containing protein [Planctomycetes bacterium]|jgi:predicted metal-dependent phosphoesterase TrpH|nr:PHP domain-containing protein [Planctomycetota bacterium]MCL4728988.1 PHP domain-containing protein [Planctomycetota bacterium]